MVTCLPSSHAASHAALGKPREGGSHACCTATLWVLSTQNMQSEPHCRVLSAFGPGASAGSLHPGFASDTSAACLRYRCTIPFREGCLRLNSPPAILLCSSFLCGVCRQVPSLPPFPEQTPNMACGRALWLALAAIFTIINSCVGQGVQAPGSAPTMPGSGGGGGSGGVPTQQQMSTMAAAFNQDVLLNSDLYSSVPEILSGGLGFTNIIGRPQRSGGGQALPNMRGTSSQVAE